MRLGTSLKAVTAALAFMPAGCHQPTVVVKQRMDQKQTETVDQLRDILNEYGIKRLRWKAEPVADLFENDKGIRLQIPIPENVLTTMRAGAEGHDPSFSVYVGLGDLSDRWGISLVGSKDVSISLEGDERSSGEIDISNLPKNGGTQIIVDLMAGPGRGVDRDQDLEVLRDNPNTISILAVPESAVTKLTELKQTPEFLRKDPAGSALESTLNFLRK